MLYSETGKDSCNRGLLRCIDRDHRLRSCFLADANALAFSLRRTCYLSERVNGEGKDIRNIFKQASIDDPLHALLAEPLKIKCASACEVRNALQALRLHGPCPEHRSSFAPVAQAAQTMRERLLAHPLHDLAIATHTT